MATFREHSDRYAADGSHVILYRDINDGSWFINRIGDRALDPMPLGAFATIEAARRWADVQFAGGSWRRTGTRRYHRV